MRPDIRQYVATEAVRRYGPLDSGLPQRLRSYIRRKTGIFVERAEILSTLALYKDVYATACSLMPRFIQRSKGKYVDHSDVRVSELVDALACEFPDEPRPLLHIAADYCVYYEYLR